MKVYQNNGVDYGLGICK